MTLTDFKEHISEQSRMEWQESLRGSERVKVWAEEEGWRDPEPCGAWAVDVSHQSIRHLSWEAIEVLILEAAACHLEWLAKALPEYRRRLAEMPVDITDRGDDARQPRREGRYFMAAYKHACAAVDAAANGDREAIAEYAPMSVIAGAAAVEMEILTRHLFIYGGLSDIAEKEKTVTREEVRNFGKRITAERIAAGELFYVQDAERLHQRADELCRAMAGLPSWPKEQACTLRTNRNLYTHNTALMASAQEPETIRLALYGGKTKREMLDDAIDGTEAMFECIACLDGCGEKAGDREFLKRLPKHLDGPSKT